MKTKSKLSTKSHLHQPNGSCQAYCHDTGGMTCDCRKAATGMCPPEDLMWLCGKSLLELLEISVEGVYIVDGEGNLEYVNPVLEREYGQWQGRKCYEYYFGYDTYCPGCCGRMIGVPQAARWVCSGSTAGGRYELAGTPLRKHDGSISTLIICRDVTEKVRTECVLRETEQRYSSLVEHAISAIFVVQNEKVVYANPEAARLLGYELGTLDGRVYWDLLHEDDRMRVREYYLARMSGEEAPAKYLKRFLRNDGQPRWFDAYVTKIDWHGEPASLVFGQDVTERICAEQALRESERMYRSVVNNANEAIFIVQDERVQYANPRAIRLLGYTADELSSRSIHDFMLPSDKPQANRFYQEKLQDRGGGERLVWRIVTKKGDIRWLEARATRIAHDSRPAVLASCTDITERKVAEEALKAANERLEAERIALEEKNVTLRTILSQIDKEKLQIASQIQTNVDRIAVPMLRRLSGRLPDSEAHHLSVVLDTLSEITSPYLSRFESRFSKLTPREVEVCSLVKKGLTSKEIATILGVAESTVVKQRKNVRKKLGIANQDINFTSFLKTLD